MVPVFDDLVRLHEMLEYLRDFAGTSISVKHHLQVHLADESTLDLQVIHRLSSDGGQFIPANPLEYFDQVRLHHVELC